MANMELTTNAKPPSSDPPSPSPPAAITTSPTNRTSSEGNNKKDEWLKKKRGWLMVGAVLSASVTYQAGLNPPGGFWQDDLQSSDFTQGHTAGSPVLATKNPIRYSMFLWYNTLAFVMPLIIIGLLLEPSFFHEELRLNLLQKFLVMDGFSLVVAFAVGSSHDFKSSGVSVLIIIVLLILYVMCVEE